MKRLRSGRVRSLSALALCAALASTTALSYAQSEGHGDHAAQAAHGEGHGPAHGNGHGEAHGDGHEAAGEHGEGHGAHHAPDSINWTSFGGTHTNAEGHEVKNPPPFIASVINFLLLLVIVVMAVKRMINPALATRRAAVEAEIAEAQRLREEAAAMHKDYTERLARMDEELNALRDEIRQAGETEAKRIIAEAEARADRMVREGEQAMAQEVRALRDDLRREAVESAVRGAEAAVRKAIGAQDQSRLTEEFLTDLEKQATSGREGAQA